MRAALALAALLACLALAGCLGPGAVLCVATNCGAIN